MKILVTGNAGSGKSTLSKQIAKHNNLKCYSLDKIVWREGWKKTPRAKRKQEIDVLISKKSWVIDGVDYDILAAADMVIFLDIPRRVCFYRAAKRNVRYLFKSRPELPSGCPEILIIPTLIRIIWNFPSRVKPKILTQENRLPGSKFIRITNNNELRLYLETSLG